uniref:non-specific serine/threonine protein kinase n=1 Tax=Fagus sylvatica TaxID=28930 RepID=A0A2N9I596_FAGSY
MITPNQPIKDGQILVSNQKTFALGFFSPGNSNRRYVGIWYNDITEKTVVWVANRDNPLNDTSGVLSINSQGNLVLHNQNQTFPIWSTNVSVSVSPTNINSMAQLLDVGNLVLVQQDNKRVIWQSFDYPTNIILPNMKIGLDRRTGLNRFLTSWKSKDDPGTGNYSFGLDPRGYPQLMLYMGRNLIWRVGSWTGQRFNALPKMSPSHIFNMNQEHWRGPHGTRVDGSGSGLNSRDSCEDYLYCGPNSNCDMSNAENFECTCLPGFEPKSTHDWYLRDGSGGCVRNQGMSTCKNGEGFVKLTRVKLPDTSVARADMRLSLKECEEECLRNCSCMGYTSADEREGGTGCLTWHGNLVDTRTFSVDGQDLYVRVDAVTLGKRQRKYSYGVASNSRFFEDSPREFDGTRRNSDLPLFDLSTIIAATNNFSVFNKLGEGGFGSVYKGLLHNGMEIAVKRLSKSSRQGIEQFKNEVELISKLQHRNLVKILGCCIQEEEKMLIYEYLPNKSLDYVLFGAAQEPRQLRPWPKDP